MFLQCKTIFEQEHITKSLDLTVILKSITCSNSNLTRSPPTATAMNKSITTNPSKPSSPLHDDRSIHVEVPAAPNDSDAGGGSTKTAVKAYIELLACNGTRTWPILRVWTLIASRLVRCTDVTTR